MRPSRSAERPSHSSAARAVERVVSLDLIAPLHTESLLGFLAARAVPGVEEVVGSTYRRSISLPHGPGVVELRLDAGAVRCELHRQDPRDAPLAQRLCRDLLDLDADPEAISSTLANDDLLRGNAPGRRVPGCVDGAEIAVRAVIGQQVSVAGARTIAGRLTAEHGRPLDAPVGGVTHLFPTSEALAALDPDTLPMPRARGRALVTLTAALAGGLDPRDRAGLIALPGIGPWTADYVAMRCGDRDVLLETDLGVSRALRALDRPDDPAWLLARAERWRPYRSYALMHLWSAA